MMLELLTKQNGMALLLGVIVFLIVFSAIRMHRDPNSDFNLLDLLMENGHVSKAAVVMMGAFALTSWMMIELTMIGKMTEGYFGLYAGAWIAPVVVKLVTQGPTSHNPRIEREPENPTPKPGQASVVAPVVAAPAVAEPPKV